MAGELRDHLHLDVGHVRVGLDRQVPEGDHSGGREGRPLDAATIAATGMRTRSAASDETGVRTAAFPGYRLLSTANEELAMKIALMELMVAKSAQLLGDFWYSAWHQAPPDTFLKRQLANRKRGSSG